MVYFQTKKSQFEYIFEDLEIENVGTFYGHLEYFRVICNNLRPFGIFYGRLIYFAVIWCVLLRNIWQPWLKHDASAVMKRLFLMIRKLYINVFHTLHSTKLVFWLAMWKTTSRMPMLRLRVTMPGLWKFTMQRVA
jgi:hypothetical protein